MNSEIYIDTLLVHTDQGRITSLQSALIPMEDVADVLAKGIQSLKHPLRIHIRGVEEGQPIRFTDALVKASLPLLYCKN